VSLVKTIIYGFLQFQHFSKISNLSCFLETYKDIKIKVGGMLECIKNVSTLTTALNTVLGTYGHAKILTPRVHFCKPNFTSHDLSKEYRNNNSKAGGTLVYIY